jgi:TRAP-type C4-dicarboxylate transport system permease small subunit
VRATLDAIYKLSGLAAGFFLVAIAVLSLTQIVARMFGRTGGAFDEFAGYAMAASSFLGLAWTLRSGEHIRMSLGIDRLRGLARRNLEILCLAVAIAVVGWFAWATAHMTWISFELDDVSQGLVPVKLWIPQSAMALGLWILLIALLDDFVLTLRGRTPSYAVPHAHDDGGTTFER